ncbi:hypothetical protein Tco_1434128 [Tanacetum coccineum]
MHPAASFKTKRTHGACDNNQNVPVVALAAKQNAPFEGGGAASGVDVVKVVVVNGAVDGGSGGWWRWCGDVGCWWQRL